MEDKDLDKLFREAFIEAEETPSPELWDRIENKLEASTQIVPMRRKASWWSYAAVATIALSLGGYLTSKIVEERPTIKLTASTAPKTITTNSHNSTIMTDEKKDDLVLIDTKKDVTHEHLVTAMTKMNTAEANSSIAEQAYIEVLEEKPLNLNLGFEQITSSLPLVRQVTEIDDIKPLFEFEEENESMLASTQTENKERKNIITSLLNTITDNMESKVNREVRFHADEEGSFSISILNSIAKNPTKKRK